MGIQLAESLRLPGGRMKLIHRILLLEPEGGRYGLGRIRAEADIHTDDWFLTCHFCDDHVMPGTLMYECCMHTLRIYLLRMGWVGEDGTTAAEHPQAADTVGIRVNVVAPGFIETDMTADLPEKVQTQMLSQIPLKRFGEGKDVAGVVKFLLSPDASYITGQTLHVNGGMFMT